MIVDISGTSLKWSTIAEWCHLAMIEGGKLRPSSDHYRRLGALYRSLTVARIRSSRDIAGLATAIRMFDLGRHNPIPSFHGLAAEFSRAEMGALLVELRNRHKALVSGRADFPRAKGPKLNPAMLTDAALDRLIQRHGDLALVERLREERNLRRAWAVSNSTS
jgi:hypothetical protein